MINVVKEKCSGCGKCVEICPAGAISMKNGKASIDLKKCAGCLACVTLCPQKAIKE